MNIEDLTLKQIREIAALAPSLGNQKPQAQHPATGKYVIVRTYSAGIHAGVLEKASGTEVELSDSRRIWSWQGALSCSEISQTGITGGKVAVSVPYQFLTEAIEIIPCSDKAEKCLRSK